MPRFSRRYQVTAVDKVLPSDARGSAWISQLQRAMKTISAILVRSVPLLAAAFASTLAVVSAAAPAIYRFSAREENGRGTRERRVSAPGALKSPVLRGFSFSREIANKNIEQLSLVLHPERGTLDAVLVDDQPQSPFGKFNWEARYAETSTGEPQRAAGYCARGQCTQLIRVPDGKSFVLSGFYFRFRNGDHHLRKLEIFETKGFLMVTCADKKPDDPYSWIVYYALVDSSSLRSDFISGSAKGSTTRQLPRRVASAGAEAVLTGFSFEFNEGDHEIREIGVILESGNALIKFNDKNDDDPFDYFVRYAWLK